jgi:glycogen debranching enzyme
MWAQRADEIVERMMAKLWEERTGLFRARHNGLAIETRTPFNLFPLLSGRLPRAVADRLVAHLIDPNEFWSPYPVPTVALDDPKFNPWQMWRGPTWVNVNYLLIEGLARSGYSELARELRRRTLALIAGHDDIYEYYNPVSGERPPKAASLFGWSAAVYIDLAIQASQERR